MDSLDCGSSSLFWANSEGVSVMKVRAIAMERIFFMEMRCSYWDRVEGRVLLDAKIVTAFHLDVDLGYRLRMVTHAQEYF